MKTDRELLELAAKAAGLVKYDSATGRVITLDKIKDAKGKTTYRVADPGERVPRHNQFLVPDKKQLGKTWNRFVQSLRDLGYKVEWRVICNADLGCHSTRTRLYMIARRDGLPIVWLKGEPWVIVDITLRMLVPRELYNAQDFPPDYIIDRTAAGKPLTKTAQVKMAGNSVSPLPMRKIVSLNYSEAGQLRKVA